MLDTTLPMYLQPPEILEKDVALFTCPSDTHHHYHLGLERLGLEVKWSLTSYSESKGVNDALCWSGERLNPPRLTSLSGMFPHGNSKVRVRNIRDGTSNTMALGEAACGKELGLGIGSTEVFHLTKDDGERLMSGHAWPGAGWSTDVLVGLDAPFTSGMCSTVEPLNKWPVTDSMQDTSQQFNCTPSFLGGPHHVSNFRSFHPGGALFLFADGHMKFISDSIDMKTYRALSTINGKEAISDGSY